MGRQRDLETVKILVRAILLNNIKGRPITRQLLLDYYYRETARLYGSPLSERSFAKAYAVMADSGILSRTNAILEFNEVNIRGEKRTGLRQILSIDVFQAMALNEPYVHEPFRRATSYLPEDVQSTILQGYREIYLSQIEQEMKIFKDLLDRFGPGDPVLPSLNPTESFAWNWQVTRVMDYLKNWKEARKA